MRFSFFNPLALWLMVCAVHALAEPAVTKTKLIIKPGKCIALHKGQECYQALKIYWHTPAQGQYCLYDQNQNEPLACWQGLGQPPLKYDFVGKQSRYFYLRDDAGQVLSQTQFLVAWVYTTDKRKSGGWRLF